ncbi:hypothetical protein ASD00_34555 [Ensifer sp. Root31]|nr:hypothetical protein ASD00_34555 [Ensifer sp. Root31]
MRTVGKSGCNLSNLIEHLGYPSDLPRGTLGEHALHVYVKVSPFSWIHVVRRSNEMPIIC